MQAAQPRLGERVSYCGKRLTARSASGFFEIHVFFSLHNHAEAILSVYDMRARLYHVSAGYSPAMMGYEPRHRVDLCADNSILSSGKVYPVTPGAALFFDLAFETGFYGDSGSTIAVFGLEVDFELSSKTGVSKWRIPSDKVYVLRHVGPPYGEGEHAEIQEINEECAAAGYEREKSTWHDMPDTASAQTRDAAVIYDSIRRMIILHKAQGCRRVD